MKFTLNALVAFVMVMALPSVQAHAATSTLDSAIKNLNFSLTVELSPSDTAGRQKAQDVFVSQVAEMQKNGVTTAEIVAAVKAQMPDAQTAKMIDTLAETAKQNKLTPAQTSQLVASKLNSVDTSGASWSAGATIGVVTAAIVITVVVVLLAGGSVSVGGGTTTYDGCYNQCYDYYYDTYYCC